MPRGWRAAWSRPPRRRRRNRTPRAAGAPLQGSAAPRCSSTAAPRARRGAKPRTRTRPEPRPGIARRPASFSLHARGLDDARPALVVLPQEGGEFRRRVGDADPAQRAHALLGLGPDEGLAHLLAETPDDRRGRPGGRGEAH